jgi:hypothetical protein
MNDWIPPISPADRSVPFVELRRLTPLQREEERQQRERQRRRKAEQRDSDGPEEGHSGIDVRV